MKVPKQEADLPPMDDGSLGGPDPMMGGSDPMGGEDPMADGPDDGGMPPMDGPEEGPDPMGDGAEDSQGSNDQQELDDIFNNASLEVKNAILKYAKSQSENDGGGDEPEGGDMGGEEPPMPMEGKTYKTKLVNEIVNGIIADFDMNDREGIEGTKRDEKKITNRKLKKGNPFVSGR